MAGPDTRNIEALPYLIWGFGPPSPEPDTKKLDALLASLNGSAERFQTLWFSFLGLTLYLAITALATTHRNLLLGEPQTLPILNIKVELLPFYVIAPLLYLVFHFYLLMMLVLLARTAAEFEDELRKTLSGNTQQERYRARIENALFLQLLVGMKSERVGFNGWLLATIAIITIAMAPVATLILIQMMFLPYHNSQITWWHRTLILADLVLIFVMWRTYFSYSSVELPRVTLSESSSHSSVEVSGLTRTVSTSSSLHLMTGNVAQIVLVVFALWLAFWEGRWAGEPWIGRQDFASTANGVLFGLFPDRLELANETIVGEEKLEKIKKEIASRGGDFVPTIKLDFRDLHAANLSGTDLRGVSLTEAAMQGANLVAARLDGAHLENARLEGAYLWSAQLQGASLVNAKLQGARLAGARLEGAWRCAVGGY
jgi:hypothetical protein